MWSEKGIKKMRDCEKKNYNNFLFGKGISDYYLKEGISGKIMRYYL